MLNPGWLADVLAAVVLATAAYCAVRLAIAPLRSRCVEYDADVMHILMGVAMAGMFVSDLRIFDTAVWGAVFAFAAAWYAARIVLESRAGRGSGHGFQHHAGHLVSAGAMVYMVFAVPSSASAGEPSASGGSGGMDMSGGGMGASAPTLALVFALLLFAYAVLVADRIPLRAAAAQAVTVGGGAGSGGGSGHLGLLGAGAGRGPLLAPRASALCEVVMSVAMGVMLIAML
jgi:hypothetical protein